MEFLSCQKCEEIYWDGRINAKNQITERKCAQKHRYKSLWKDTILRQVENERAEAEAYAFMYVRPVIT